MIRISVVSSKGGVGKSAIIYFLSLLLAKKYKILIVDLSTSSTLSNLFGLKGNIIDSELDYFSEKDNVSIVSFSTNTIQTESMRRKRSIVLEKYYDILRGKDIVFVEYPLHLNVELTYFEYSMFKNIIPNSDNYILSISDPIEYIIYSTKNYVNGFLKVINEDQKILGLIINRVQPNIRLNMNAIKQIFENLYVIKFYREMLFKGFWNVSVPEDIYPIYTKINELL